MNLDLWLLKATCCRFVLSPSTSFYFTSSLTELGRRLTSSIPGTSVFLFGKADAEGRGLVQRRKEVGWFKRPVVYHHLSHDLGSTPTPTHGLTGVGAIPYMMNVNLTLDTSNLTLGRRVAASLRASSPGGLPGVQAMAFPHKGRIEVACNVDLLPRASLSTTPSEHVMDTCLGEEYVYTPASEIERRVHNESGGVALVGTTLVGFTPDQARTLALKALTSGLDTAWKTVTAKRRM
ncbi:hypothetical protein Pmani_035251 [Petrolisthes manimaculis]|uniref:Uncharacterized protein n=1 Tax=Petrolisthes manimaculis TaxID=1843537 RepID=A0AAE1NKV7_9EUCA|nr:hypothetical protein Pmani_035251 [Petrolisthes manimaculis]